MSSIRSTRPSPSQTPASSHGYQSAALDAIVRVQLAANAPQLLERLIDATTSIGASASIYTVQIPEGSADPSTFSLFACHPVLARTLCSDGVPLDHDWLRPMGSRARPTVDARRSGASPGRQHTLELARRHGFRSTLVVPTPSGADPQRLEVLCLGSEHPDAFEHADAQMMRTLARTLAGELHVWVARHLSDSLRQSARIRTEDVDLLRLEWMGLSSKEIGQRTGMSISTLDSRFYRLNLRMQCDDRKASARRAAAYGLL